MAGLAYMNGLMLILGSTVSAYPLSGQNVTFTNVTSTPLSNRYTGVQTILSTATIYESVSAYARVVVTVGGRQ
jgi:hypothetical protein